MPSSWDHNRRSSLGVCRWVGVWSLALPEPAVCQWPAASQAVCSLVEGNDGDSPPLRVLLRFAESVSVRWLSSGSGHGVAAHHWEVLSGCQRSSLSATPHLVLEGKGLVSRGSGRPEHRGTSPAQRVRSVPSWRCRQRLLEFQTRSASPLVSLTSLKNVCGSPLVSEHYLDMTLLWSYTGGSAVFARREPWPSRLSCPLGHTGLSSGAWQ